MKSTTLVLIPRRRNKHHPQQETAQMPAERMSLQVGPTRKDGRLPGCWLSVSGGIGGLLLLLASCSANAGPTAQVLSVGDGDTITVRDQNERVKVRLACIDAPETSQRPYGQQAKQALQAMLPIGTPVRLQVKDVDRYGRTVAEVFGPGQSGSVNLQMVSQGMAYIYRQYFDCDPYTYGEAEAGAAVSKRGLWAVPGLQRPWDYRKCKRSGGC